ncbi:MAG: hypothetical protein V3V08_03680 [Nannocystaceae bacterium]
MAKSRRASVPLSRPTSLYQQLLLFPERAEYLEQARYERYLVHLEHWQALSTEFRLGFEAVYERRSARILLVHGGQGTGKTLFARRVAEDFIRVKEGRPCAEVQQNLWLRLAGSKPVDREVGEKAAQTTALRRIHARSGWLEEERKFAKNDTTDMRVFLVDDVHKDGFLREWAGLSAGEYMRLKAEGHLDAILESVAQKLVEDCRGDFQRALFVLLSNDAGLLDNLHEQLERWHSGLAHRVELPLPEPDLKEKIVRTNTNRLNRLSYWYCLDRGGPDEKKRAYDTMRGDGGFVDSFKAIDRALTESSSRSGRPANKNLLTLVTLGSDPLTIASHLEALELESDDALPGEHVGTWLFRQRWASTLATDDQEYARRAELLESEFTLRWVTLDMAAWYHLHHAPTGDGLCETLVEIMRSSPSIGDLKPAKDKAKQLVNNANVSLSKVDPSSDVFRDFECQCRDAGRSRSLDYEAMLARRFGMTLSRGLEALTSIRPDLTLAQYEPCAVTSAPSSGVQDIRATIRRTCHVIEFTSHLQLDLRGLDDYLRSKVDVYASLLESV